MPVDLSKLATADDGFSGLEIAPVEQETDFSCGAAALLAVLWFFGVGEDLEEDDLYAQLGTTPEDGTNAENIARVAQDYGLRANWRTGVSIDDLRRAVAEGVPVILDLQALEEEPDEPSEHYADGHFVVVVAVDGDAVEYMDPAIGDYASLSIADLEERWHDVEGERGAIFVDGRGDA